MEALRLAFILISLMSLCACAPQPAGESFTLRRLNTTLSIDELVTANPSELSCADEALITTQDIAHYDWATHTFTLTPKAAARLAKLDLVGTPFVVCVDGSPIYAGVFWSSLFSRSYDGIVIDVLLLSADAKLHIATGYPESPEGFAGEDRRSDVRIWRALYTAGKVP